MTLKTDGIPDGRAGRSVPEPIPTCEEPLARRNRQLEALFAMASELGSGGDLKGLLQHSLERVVEALECPSGVIRLLDPVTGELVIAASSGLPPALAAAVPASIQAGDGPAGLSAQCRSLVVLDDLLDSGFADSIWSRHGYRTFVSVPLQCRGRFLGTLNLAAHQAGGLSAEQRDLLSALTNIVCVAVANSDLYAGTQRIFQHFSALHQFSQDVGPAPDLPRVLQLTAERLAQLLRLERSAVVCWFSEEEDRPRSAARGFAANTLENLRAPAVPVPEAAVLITEGDRPGEHPESGLLPVEFIRSERVRSALVLRLAVDGEVIGLLVGDRGEAPLHLSADEMESAMIFANQAAVWIASSRLLLQEQAARAAAESSEARFRELLESSPDATVIVGNDGRIALVNSQVEKLFGYPREELIGGPVELLMPERYRAAHVGHRSAYQAEPRTRPMGSSLDLFARRRDGSEFPVEISLSPTQADGSAFTISVIRDVTERKGAEHERAQLLASERAKSEQLKLAVREAHHRIKNNLQAISDLLYLEMASGGAGAESSVLQESIERIQSIALVHDLLSHEEDVQTVDLRAMVEALVPMVLRNAGAAAEAETLVPSVPLSSKKATTLALILNELVSNAAKHSFFERRSGRLQVSVTQSNDGLLLQVQDDGPGLPEGFDLERDANMGLQVVCTLAERDLGGKFSLSSGPGLTAEIWFPW